MNTVSSTSPYSLILSSLSPSLLATTFHYGTALSLSLSNRTRYCYNHSPLSFPGLVSPLALPLYCFYYYYSLSRTACQSLLLVAFTVVYISKPVLFVLPPPLLLLPLSIPPVNIYIFP